MTIQVDLVGESQRVPAPPKPTGKLPVEPIPAVEAHKPTPLLKLIMPLVMVVMMVAMVVFMTLGRSSGNGMAMNPMMLMMPMMMVMGLFSMFSPSDGSETDETRRTYLRHLGVLRKLAAENAKAQRLHEVHKHPDPADLYALISGPQYLRLWERLSSDSDAFQVRLGLGKTRLCTPLELGDAGATEDVDPVCAVALRRTLRAANTVAGIPIVVSLDTFRFISLIGIEAAALTRAIIAQLVVFHGPETLSINVYGGQENSRWQWLKWLPHTRNPENSSFKILLVDEESTTGMESFIDDEDIDLIIDIGTGAPTALYARAQDEGLVIKAEAGEIQAFTVGGAEKLGTSSVLSQKASLYLARRMARYERPVLATGTHFQKALSTKSGALKLPSKVGLPDLLGIRELSQLQPDNLWPIRNNARSRLLIPFGSGTAGVPISLDIKESAHGGVGPHGLCIGATGSGKSELLRSLVVALAVTHSPDELNMVLVDFKGGATFLGLEGLPHTSAVITNLEDEAGLVERMRDALSGEMNRRQEKLRTAGNFSNVVDYETARTSGERPDLAPLPALFIVVDEFSELLGQHPDFADLFVAIGRLGRSLQVHLLLASQRLEEGRLRGLDSHLSYRIGLRTFSAAESRQVLGITDAYRLPSAPGAGYLKTGADEISAFQAAYVSGPVERLDNTAAAAPEISLFTSWPQETHSPTYLDHSTTVLEEVVKITQLAAAKRSQQAHKVWLDPLPEIIELSKVVVDIGALKTCVGIIDRPYYQRQDPLQLDFNAGSGHLAICGSPRTGKTTALRTIATALAATHYTSQIRFYVLDLGGNDASTNLLHLERLPHTSGVASRKNPARIRRVIDEVATLIADGGELQQPHARHTFLFIDGWHVLLDDFEDCIETLTRIAADGPAAGVHLIISTSRWTLLRPAIRDLISLRLELRLGEAMDSLIDRKVQEKLPNIPGRGITQESESFLFARATSQDIGHIQHISATQPAVPALEVLPDYLSLSQLQQLSAIKEAQQDLATGVLMGQGGPRLAPLRWNSQHLVVIGSRGAGKSTALATALAGLCDLGRENIRIVLVDHRRAHLGRIAPDFLAGYSATTAATTELLKNTLATLKKRLPGPEITAMELKNRSWWQGPEIAVVIDDLDVLGDEVLFALKEILPHALDVGLKLVIGRSAGGIGRALFQPFLAAVKDQQPTVILLDADRDEGNIFGIKPQSLAPGRGIWQQRGDISGPIQVACTESDSELEQDNS
ncbi:type VII secretion protein EccC [Corynebacterium caspium]|uniref:type VII secretion protein EccC n=1 Tax=Corynebacterium caspium TaxID=234828 RepID=UPI0003794DDD|nr:type VII secretion protein EccC [Corynebacterium caspium]WKD59809.1 ESX-1 secretion system protein EccCa1 [Corynebacterium caspium DSM 44850]